MAELATLAGIYRRLVGARIRGQLEYRLSFALNLVGAALISFLDFAGILIIFENVPALAGWSIAEVALLYGLSSISFALTDLAVGHIDLLPTMIREGTFDGILVRPLGSLFQVVASDFALRRLGKALQGVAILAVALAHVDVDWTPGRVAMLLVAVVSGSVIFAGVWIAAASVTFWTIDSSEFANAFTYGGNFLAQYPINLFGAWLRRFVVFVVPIAFVGYFPALYVLGKDDPLGFPRALQLAPPLVAAASALAGVAVWRAAVRHYRSVGS